MSLKRYLLIMGLGTIISSASWFLVLIFLDPHTSGFIGRALFFASFFLAVFGVTSIVGYLVRRLFQRHQTPFRLVAISFRQGTLISALITASLILQSQRLFTWWTALSLFVFFSLLESFFVARSPERTTTPGGSRGT